MFGGRTAQCIAEQYAASPAAARSQRSALWGARALLRVLPARRADALALATRLDLPDVSIQVCV